MKKALVLLPTYNEAENASLIIKRLFEVGGHIKGYVLEILVIDDSSPDGTGKIVRALSKNNDKLHLTVGKKNGLGSAYIRGFRIGLKKYKPDAFIMMDADFSHSPNDIPRLLAAIDEGHEYVIGSRYMDGGAIPGNWPIKRILNSRVANWLATTLLGGSLGVFDMTGGFKAIKRSALERVNLSQVQASGYVFQLSLLHAFHKANADIAEVPITFTDRRFGSSKLRKSDIIEFLYRAYRLNPDAPIQRLARFLLVGISGVIVNLVAAALLVHLGVYTLMAVAIAIEASIISNFFLHESYTFSRDIPDAATSRFFETLFSREGQESYQDVFKRLGKFNASSLIGAAISFLIFTLLFKVGWFYLMADLIAIACSTAWNFFFSIKFVWRAQA
ncbi:MAG TPA: glycosyltransferase [Candidatus Saccharimonadia bacterium]|jgi:dolichol-phosphate mannosyltransferase